MREELPKNWVYARLDQVANVVAGNPAPQGHEYFDGGKYNFVRVHDMGENSNRTYLDTTRDLVNDKAIAKLRLFPSESVLFTKSGASTLLNQRAILSKESYVVSHIAAAIPFDGIESKWVFYFLSLIDFATLAHATNMPSLPVSRAKSIEVPLAPEAEQRRIVSKIEELFSELDKGVENLETAREQLKVYRQAVLKHAFEGKLTAQWREENKDKLETPEQLLARIKREREERYEQQLSDWKVAVKVWQQSNKSGKKPSKPRPLLFPESLTDMELTTLPEIPDRWRWVKVGELFSVYVGATPSRKNRRLWHGEISWISSSEVCFTRIDRTRETVTKEGLANTSMEVHPIGTVMLGMIGEGKTRGQAAITHIEACHNQNTAAIRVSESDISPEYVYYYLLYRYEHTRRLGSGNNQKALNKERVSNLAIPLSSLDEQAVLVQALEKHLLVITQINNEISNQITSANSLRQSILKAAFAGQLVTQDPNDEPASKLLDRIRIAKSTEKLRAQA